MKRGGGDVDGKNARPRTLPPSPPITSELLKDANVFIDLTGAAPSLPSLLTCS